LHLVPQRLYKAIMKIKKGDKVTIITGKDKGKSGEIIRALPKRDSVIVSGLNKVKKHERPKNKNSKGQTIEVEMPVHISNIKKQ